MDYINSAFIDKDFDKGFFKKVISSSSHLRYSNGIVNALVVRIGLLVLKLPPCYFISTKSFESKRISVYMISVHRKNYFLYPNYMPKPARVLIRVHKVKHEDHYLIDFMGRSMIVELFVMGIVYFRLFTATK